MNALLDFITSHGFPCFAMGNDIVALDISTEATPSLDASVPSSKWVMLPAATRASVRLWLGY